MLLVYSSAVHSPVGNEVAHLVSGISHWELGRFELYQVNPPLVRSLAALPVVAMKPQTDWSGAVLGPGARPEHVLAVRYGEANRETLLGQVFIARLACLPLSLLGAWVCYRWASELYGHESGLLAMTCWCLSPAIVAYGSTIVPDAGAAALGLAAAYLFWQWLRSPDLWWAMAAGLALGLAELAKTTWIVLFFLWPLLWGLWRWRSRGEPRRLREGGQLAIILLLGLGTLNLGYGFQGSFRPLGEYDFVSRLFGGSDEDSHPWSAGRNRFRETLLAGVPVPLPKDYVLGIDLQKRDFELKWPSYLRGEWRQGGWWYYYLYALAVKTPLGFSVLILLAAAGTALRRAYSAPWRDEVVLLTPAVVVIVLVSSQWNMNVHCRYVLPALPFVFVWIAKIARALALEHRRVVLAVGIAVAWSIESSLWVYPHSLSYFNELAGGPGGGHRHLLGSCLDDGQDILYLRRWCDKRPHARPGTLPGCSPLEAVILGKGFVVLPPACESTSRRHDEAVLRPGWYFVGVNQLYGPGNEHACLRTAVPVGTAGYSVRIYHFP